MLLPLRFQVGGHVTRCLLRLLLGTYLRKRYLQKRGGGSKGEETGGASRSSSKNTLKRKKFELYRFIQDFLGPFFTINIYQQPKKERKYEQKWEEREREGEREREREREREHYAITFER